MQQLLRPGRLELLLTYALGLTLNIILFVSLTHIFSTWNNGVFPGTRNSSARHFIPF